MSRQINFIQEPAQLSAADPADVSRPQSAQPDRPKLQPHQLPNRVPDMVHQAAHNSVPAYVQRQLDLGSIP